MLFGYNKYFKNSAFDKPRKKTSEKKIKVKIKISDFTWCYLHVLKTISLLEIQMKVYANLILKREKNWHQGILFWPSWKNVIKDPYIHVPWPLSEPTGF